VLRAPRVSLINYRPPRITRKSYGLEPQIEPWLTMFNRAACLASESESAVTKTEWIYERAKTKSSQHDLGWKAKRRTSLLQSPQTYLLLTFPFIELRR